MAGRIQNLDGYDIGSPVEGRPYRTPTPEQVAKRWVSLEREREQYEKAKLEDNNGR